MDLVDPVNDAPVEPTEELLGTADRGVERPDVLDEELAMLLARYGRYWSREAAAEPVILRAGAIDLLAAMDLVTVGPSGRVIPRPAAARFAPEVTVARSDQPVQETLL